MKIMKKIFCYVASLLVATGAMIGCTEDITTDNLLSNEDANKVEFIEVTADIEVSDDIENEESRIISIKLSNVGKMLSLHFDNYCADKLIFKDGLPVTTKDDKGLHGYGLRSIRYVVHKYGGKMSVFQKDNTFNMNILFPIAVETPPAEEGK